jgi:hypothetical protein
VDDAASRVPPEYLVAVRKWAANNRRDGQVDGLVAALLEHAQPLAANIATGAKPPVDLRTVVPEVRLQLHAPHRCDICGRCKRARLFVLQGCSDIMHF